MRRNRPRTPREAVLERRPMQDSEVFAIRAGRTAGVGKKNDVGYGLDWAEGVAPFFPPIGSNTSPRRQAMVSSTLPSMMNSLMGAR